ncbi:MAG: sulfate adenylyltransferase subunit CysN [Xanthomonadales bacterium]|nr:sulfate adenylyltransferase subunit CysN [Xanthomonadales bacterium]NNK51892.1 sulfate adenylyltransferase subunit CysN [Xanthomonadales bacterium]
MQEESLIRADIGEYLKRHEDKDLLRLLTCGSVDDGKSTLIGRLLYDCHMIYEDQLAKVASDSKVWGTTDDGFDPALLTDGLRAEREQGITIDVAYRYFSTDKRKFIIADCPGHEQYTRNMATGASTCNLAVILIDARYGVISQTRRHSFICSLLGIKHVVVAVNKMDLIDWSEDSYDRIMRDYNSFVARLNFSDIHFIPMSALRGDNVVERSRNLSWYDGPTLLSHLESLNISTDRNLIDMRLPIQYVLRPNLDFRGYSGTLASGVLRTGDRVASLPSRQQSRVKKIYGPDGEIEEAFSPMAITVSLEDEIDVSRGNMLVPVNNLPHVGNEFEAMVVWMHENAATEGTSYLVKHSCSMVPGVLSRVRYKVDVNTMQRDKGDQKDDAEIDSLNLNEIGRCHLTLHRPIAFDPYDRNRATGAFIIVDRLTNVTVGAGMIVDRIVSRSGRKPAPVSQNIQRSGSLVSAAERRALMGQRGVTVWLTGLSASGKSTIARQLEKQLVDLGRPCYILDGDNVRHGLNRDLGFSMEDRQENIRRIAEVAALMNDAGVIVITAFISPYRQDRQSAREVIGDQAFIEAFVDTPLEVCEQRDPKGLYKKARAGEIRQFTGVSDVYEPPLNAEITLPTATISPAEAADRIIEDLGERGVTG